MNLTSRANDAVLGPQRHAWVRLPFHARGWLRREVDGGVRRVPGVERAYPVGPVAVQAELTDLVRGAAGVAVPVLEGRAELAQDRRHLRRADQLGGPEAARAERAVGQPVVALAVEVPRQRGRWLLLSQLPLLP